jgi:chromosomal replication initiator protein
MLETTMRIEPKSYMVLPAIRRKPMGIMAHRILELVCVFYGVDKVAALGKNRHKPVCMARHVTAYLLKKYTPMTLKEIGQFLGGRDHTTALNSMNQMKGWLETDDVLEGQVKYLRSQI